MCDRGALGRVLGIGSRLLSGSGRWAGEMAVIRDAGQGDEESASFSDLTCL